MFHLGMEAIPMNLKELEYALPIVAGLCIGKTTEAEDEAVDLVVKAARLYLEAHKKAAHHQRLSGRVAGGPAPASGRENLGDTE